MLKIKDLEKIKKFGELKKDETYPDSWDLKRKNEFGGILFKIEDNRIWSNTDDDLLYVLIKAELVEKVED